MKTNWQTKKLGEVCEFQGGTQPPKSTFIYEPREGYIRLLQIRDFKSDKNVTFIKDNSKLKKCNEDDIMIGRYGASVGQILSGKSGAYNVALMKALPDISILDKAYLKYFLETSEMQNWFSNCQRAAQAGFTQDEIGENKIPIPPLATQQKIVVRLDELLGNIAEAKRLRQEAIADTEKILSQTLREIFEEGKEWEEKKLEEVARVINGRAYKQQELLDSGKYPVLRVGNFFTNRGWYYSDLELEPDKYCDNGDLLYAWSASFGPRIWEGDKVIFHYHIWKIEHSEILNKKFLYYFLETKTEQFKSDGGRGATMMHLTKGNIEKIKVPLPPLLEQHQIVTRLDTLSAKLRELRQLQVGQLEDLRKLEKAYLREAFNGELV